jgi:fluoroquinolone transport system ATP-binding protein
MWRKGIHMIEVENLEFTYPKAAQNALKGISFSVEKGEIFGFLGPNAAGKSTTQKILIGLLKGFKGDISVLGRNLNEWKSDYYERIGISFEIPNHFLKLTALENLEYFSSLYGGNTEDPHTLLGMVGLENDGNIRVSQYSKGMRVRLGFIRALLHDPEILFLDEPTSGLDPVNAKIIRRIILQKKKAGKTIFLTTHDMMVADTLCDRVAFIIDGEISLIDSPRALKLQHGKRLVRIEYQEDGSIKQQEFSLENLGEDPQFLQLLKTKKIETIHSQEATLEDIFITVTGRRLV